MNKIDERHRARNWGLPTRALLTSSRLTGVQSLRLFSAYAVNHANPVNSNGYLDRIYKMNKIIERRRARDMGIANAGAAGIGPIERCAELPPLFHPSCQSCKSCQFKWLFGQDLQDEQDY